MCMNHLKRQDTQPDTQQSLGARLAPLFDSKKQPLEAQMAAALGHGVLAHEYAERDDKALQNMVQHALATLQNFKTGSLVVEVANPSFSESTVITVMTDDQPFLLDSLRLELEAADLHLHHVLHPVVKVEITAKGSLQRISLVDNQDEQGDGNIALMLVECDVVVDAAARKALAKQLTQVLQQAQQAVADFPKMVSKMEEQLAVMAKQHQGDAQLEENISFLNWLLKGNFVFLGYRAYDIKHTKQQTTVQALENSTLGILPKKSTTLSKPVALEKLASNLQRYYKDDSFLTITKAFQKSPIHRRADLDYISLREHDAKGRVTKEHRFMGLFTSSAYTANAREIPIIGHKIRHVLEQAKQHGAQSYNYRGLLNILEMYPRDELFQISVDELSRIAHGLLHIKERYQVRVFVRHAAHEQTVSVLVYLPRDVMSSDLRKRIEQILATSFQATDVEFQVKMGSDRLARVLYKLRCKEGELRWPTEAEVEALVQEAARKWTDDLAETLAETNLPAMAQELFKRYGQAFSSGYQENTPASIAVEDIAALEHMRQNKVPFYVTTHYAEGDATLRLRIFNENDPITLAQVMPHLSTMGLNVEDERPSEIRDNDGRHVWLHDFGVALAQDQSADLMHVMMLTEALTLIWRGEFTSDRLNQLILTAGLTLPQIDVLRGLSGYVQQTTRRYGLEMIHNTLVKHHDIAAKLADLFDARFALDTPLRESAAKQDALSKDITQLLKQVTVLDEDRVLQRFHDVVLATVRTNVAQRASFTDPLVIKLDSSQIEGLVKPVPWREIYVYHQSFEGVHMRGGPVARGGLRWSDRPTDFRTEVLGLVKTQVVKNTVIVPTGSKGGFVVKTPLPADRAAAQELVEATYKRFIQSLLCVTDNFYEGEVYAPRRVCRYDEDDPYLVVAADKGTATFSDVANGEAEKADYWDGISSGFWLNDAFASGGSNGYDHKVMGITARGAWECVRHHFTMRGVDIQTTDFTVAGIGDMGGDVFGNGMLLSEHIRLQAAFNHRHIFLDPNPNAAKTYKERQRLFEARGGWDQYNTKLLSKGGGIFERSAKEIKLNKSLQELLGTTESTLNPDEVIRLILKMEVDLLWNGGIGTYVKATSESDIDVGDRANDELRVNASDVRAKVMGEGGNLGFTQRGRIEYALNGGAINTDAIDNSAGVGASDREVNLKILFKLADDQKLLDREARNTLLADMTDEVATLVLRDNQLQSWALTLKEQMGAEANDTNYRLMCALSQRGLLDRRLEAMPDEEELERRRREGTGFTRPELSVLMAYAKIALKEDLVNSPLADDASLRPFLTNYFPQPVQQKFDGLLNDHRLCREIVVTGVVNQLVNRMGITFLNRMVDETGHKPATVARAFVASKRLFEGDRWWELIEQLAGKVPAETQVQMMENVKRLIEFGAFWLLRKANKLEDIAAIEAEFGTAINSIASQVPQHCTPRMAERLAHITEKWQQAGLSEDIAEAFALLPTMTGALDVAWLAGQAKADVGKALSLYFMASDRLQLARLKNMALELSMENNWQRVSALTILDELYGHHRAVGAELLSLLKKGKTLTAVFDKWTELRGPALKQYDRLLEELGDQADITHPMLVAVLGQLKGLTT